MAGANDTVIQYMADVGFRGADAVKSWKKVEKKIQDSLGAALGTAMKAGFDARALMNWERKLEEANKKRQRSEALYMIKKEKLQARIDARNIGQEELRRKQSELRGAKRRAEIREKEYKVEENHVKDLGAKRAKSIKHSAAMIKKGDAAEAFGDELESAFSDIKGGNLGGLFKKSGKLAGATAGKAGDWMQSRGEEKGGVTGGAMGGFGKILSKLGPALLMVGGIVAGFAAIIKLILDADSKAKELNKTLLDSGVTIGGLRAEIGTVGEKIDAVRDTFANAFSFNVLWGTNAEDHLKILGAYEEAGLTFDEISRSVRGAADNMEFLKVATVATLTYSKLFNVSSSDMSSNMSEWMETLGHNFDTVQESLSAVYMAAKDSGFGVKRFYGMVQQATSGMSMYNVRLEETAGLLIRMGKILGSQRAGAFVQDLGKGFADKGMGERYKQVKAMGPGKMQGTYQRSAEATARAFSKKLEKADMGPAFSSAAKRAGVDMGGDTKTLVKTLGKLDSTQRARLLGEVSNEGNEDLVRQLASLMSVSRGARGGTENMAMELGSLDMGGKLVAKLNAVAGVIGEPIHEMKLTQLMTYESLAGYSGEQLKELKRVSETLYGQWDILKDEQKARKKGKDFDKKLAEDQVKKLGYYVGEDKKIYSAKLDKQGRIDEKSKVEIENLQSYIQSNGESLAQAVKDGVPGDIKLAQKIAENTTEMSHVLEVGVAVVLNRIYQAVQSIRNWATGLEPDEKKAREEILVKLHSQMDKVQNAMRAQNKITSGLEVDLITAKGGDREKIKEKLAAGNKRMGILQGKDVLYKAQEEAAMQIEGGGVTGSDKTKADQLAEIKKATAAEAKAQAEKLVGKDVYDSRVAEKMAELREKNARIKEFNEPGSMEDPRAVSLFDNQSKTDTEQKRRKLVEKQVSVEILSSDKTIEAIDKETREAKIAAKKASDDQTKKLPEEVARRNAEELRKTKKAEDVKDLAEMFRLAGSKASYETRLGWSESMISGNPSEEAKAALAGTATGGGTIASKLQDKKLPGQASETLRPAQDILFRAGAGGVQSSLISPQDAVLAAKAGGPFSKAVGGGGGNTNVFHLYNDGPGVMSAIRKAQSAGAL